MSVLNDNLIIKDSDGKVKLQCTCYRLFIVYVVGYCSITTALIQKAAQFGFYFALLTTGFRMYCIFGGAKEGNTLLKMKQYEYKGVGLARHITENKIYNQYSLINSIRNKNELQRDTADKVYDCFELVKKAESIEDIMGYEGIAARMYFSQFFSNMKWNGRQPRLKRDFINATLDIGYTILFTLIDSLLSAYGFDTYVGVLHRQFYMRKSLVCDLVEPFRCIVDRTVKKAYGLKQIKEEDFIIINGQYRLKWENNAKYISILTAPLMDKKDEVFLYIQSYYRAFMKELPDSEFPFYEV